ncbi:MAG: 2,5-diamino-6-(ribosylamino)-4(3H)-pyrimidinone 5'-phosphate reductase [Anaerolineales bacterium]
MNRPYVFINVAASADGKIDAFERRGAALSSARDKERVDELRASADAILVGGETLRRELPKLTVKSEARREARIKLGKSPNPMKVGIITRADIPLKSDFMEAGAARKVIFTTGQTSINQIAALRAAGAEVFLHQTPRVNLKRALQTLKTLGVERLMIEGGGTINFEALRLGLVDEIMIYLAPKIFGGANAPTLADGLGFSARRALALRLVDVETHEDGGVVLKYAAQR